MTAAHLISLVLSGQNPAAPKSPTLEDNIKTSTDLASKFSLSYTQTLMIYTYLLSGIFMFSFSLSL